MHGLFMSIIKSFSVKNGDMFYIAHNSSSLTIIDCNIDDECKERVATELLLYSLDRNILRFISTHPDEDHLHGLKFLDEKFNFRNFYCVQNNAIEDNPTEDFKHYCTLRDRKSTFYVYKGCQRKWLNQADENNTASGIKFLWPDVTNNFFKEELRLAAQGISFNNISPIFTYSLENGVKAMWMGDLENSFLEKVKNNIDWPEVDILFAPHHGRKSGRVPSDVLKKINPSIIVIGEAPSEHLMYYNNYNTITQNTAGDIIFNCEARKVHIFTSKTYHTNYLVNEYRFIPRLNYIGSLQTR